MRFPWQKQDDDLRRELSHHLAELTDELIRQGHSPREATQLAKKQFGPLSLIEDQCRDESPWAFLSSLLQDLHFGLRQLRQTPVVTLAAVLSLALGIGANSALLSLMNTILWRSLPVSAPENIRLLHHVNNSFPENLANNAAGSSYAEGASLVSNFFSHASLLNMQSAAGNKATIAPYSFSLNASLSFEGRPHVAYNRPISAEFFSALTLQPHIGRLFRPEENTPSSAPVAVLSHRFYRNFFGENPNVIGRSLRLDNKLYQIIGVLPPSFYGLLPSDPTDLYTPLWQSSGFAEAHNGTIALNDPRAWVLQGLLRLHNTTAEQLHPQLTAAFRQSWLREKRDNSPDPTLRLDDGSRGIAELARQFRNPLYILGALLALVLLIACANIANLLLARSTARQKEVALRISLGCSRSRLLRQFLTESTILATLGGLSSIAVAYATARLVGQFLSDPRNPQPLPVTLDLPMAAAILFFSLLTVFLFGLFPALRASAIDTNSALKQGPGSPPSRSGFTPGRVLIVTQMAFSLILVTTAVLFTANLRALTSRDVGFESRNILIFGLRPGSTGYNKQSLPSFYLNLESRLASTAGVAEASIAEFRPMNQGGWWGNIRVPGQTTSQNAAFNTITPTYLKVFAPSLRAGRHFTYADSQPNAPKVVILSEDLAQKLFPNQNPVGLQIDLAESRQSPDLRTVVGIAPAFAFNSIKERPSLVWFPFNNTTPEATIILRTSTDPRQVLSAVEATLKQIDPNLPLVDTFTMQELITRDLHRERMFASLCAAFGVLALVLSVIGLYGVMSYHASRRRTEIGVRLALGSSRPAVLWLVLREAMLLTTLGLLIASPAVYYGSTFIEKELFELKALNPWLLSLSTLLLTTAALLAAYLPARRAALLDPSTALRQD